MQSLSRIPENARKELYSLAYASAVAASAGVELMTIKFDYDSVDCQLISTKGKRPQMGLQLKATAAQCIQGEELLFDLPLKNYNDLRDPDRHVPTILVVLHLPEPEEHWLQYRDQELLLKNAAYYLNLVGLPETNNLRTVRVTVPLTQRFDRDSVERLMTFIGQNWRLP